MAVSAHLRPQTPEPLPHETEVQDVDIEADPHADLPRGLVLLAGPESQMILEIRV